MRQGAALDGVTTFVAVAQAGSFSGAARDLGISPSAVSQAIGALEERLGTSLFRRSTRSISLTDIGKDYLLAVAPALAQLQKAAADASGRAGRPSGALRLTMPRAPFDLVIADTLVDFAKAYPEIDIEIAVEARLVDIVKQGFDAGLRYGSCLEKDMCALEVAPPSEAFLVASPRYMSDRGAPSRPADLLEHQALMCRSQASGVITPWSLRCGDDSVQIVPRRAMIVHDLASQIELAIRGAGIVSAPSAYVSRHLEARVLARVLPEWSSPMDALYLYYPSARHHSATLRAFKAFLETRTEAAVESDARHVSDPTASNLLPAGGL